MPKIQNYSEALGIREDPGVGECIRLTVFLSLLMLNHRILSIFASVESLNALLTRMHKKV